MNAKQLQITAWGISTAVVVLAVVAWGQGYDWELAGLSTYQLFPLFGLLAFSLMWSHYIAAALRQYLQADRAALKQYFEVTSLAVLAAILLHPGLLGWQLWRDGIGLPPGSYKAYIGPLYWAVVLGIISWLIFMSYELRRKFKDRSWWKYVQYASDGAMFLILIHALRLGQNLQEGWFRTVWYFYGVTLALSLAYTYYQKLRRQTT